MPGKRSKPSNFYVSQSKVQSWLLCRMKYHYQYVLSLRKKAPPRPLKFGSIAHQVIEADAEGEKKPIEKILEKVEITDRHLFRQEREMYGDIMTDMNIIMRAYFRFWEKEPIQYVKVNGKFSEHLIEADLTNDIMFKGTLDAQAANRRMTWLVEHKTHRTIPNDDHRWRNLQTCVYMPLAQDHGFGPFDGVLWDYIRSKPPTRPKLKKDGTLSERELDTLPEAVLDTIRQERLNPAAYRGLLASAEANMSSYFQRIYRPVKANVVKAVMRDFVETAKMMSEAEGMRPTRTLGKHCDWCQYEPLCRAALQGNDIEMVKEREYVKEEDRYARFEEAD